MVIRIKEGIGADILWTFVFATLARYGTTNTWRVFVEENETLFVMGVVLMATAAFVACTIMSAIDVWGKIEISFEERATDSSAG